MDMHPFNDVKSDWADWFGYAEYDDLEEILNLKSRRTRHDSRVALD